MICMLTVLYALHITRAYAYLLHAQQEQQAAALAAAEAAKNAAAEREAARLWSTLQQQELQQSQYTTVYQAQYQAQFQRGDSPAAAVGVTPRLQRQQQQLVGASAAPFATDYSWNRTDGLDD
jgi:hypothetical protein